MMADKLGPKLGVAPMPAADPKRPGTLASLANNVLFASSRNKEAAFTFISWLSETKAMEKWSASPQGQLPALKSVAKLPRFADDVFTKVSLEQTRYALAWPPLPGVGYLSAAVWGPDMQRALLGQIESKDMMNDLAKALQR